MSTEHDIPENPYPGLRPFSADETHLFFGRDAQTAELLRRLQQARFLAVVGTSGSGKSSLVRAGMLQGLHGGLLAGGSQWRVVDLRPGTDPIGNLAAALDRPGALSDAGCSAEESFTDATLRRSSLGLVQAVREARLAPRERVLVLVDQFEELFRAIDDRAGHHVDDDAAAFVQLLLAAAQQQALPIYVALTMRSDFLGECARFRDLPEAISDGQYLIPRLNREQLREAITGPAAVHGVALSDRLVDRLLNDLGGNPDQLPILQHALMRTWDLWAEDPARGQVLDLDDYERERIGGMDNALSRHADEVLASLGEGEPGAPVTPRRIAECLFKALAKTGPGGQLVRRFASVQSVADIAGVPPGAVMAVVEAFRAPGNSFLMPPAGEPLDAGTDIDISHESLIRNWTTVRTWLAEEAESVRLYERLSTTAAEHAQGHAGLLPGPDLSRALAWRDRQRPTAAWARRHAGDFAQTMDFIDDSAVAASAADGAQTGRRRMVRAALVLSLVALLGLSLAWLAEETARRFNLEVKSQVARAVIQLVQDLERSRETAAARGGALDDATCAGLRQRMGLGNADSPVAAAPFQPFVPLLDALCHTQAERGAANSVFDRFFEWTSTLERGEFQAAQAQLAELDPYLGLPAQILLDTKLALQGSSLGPERRALGLRQEQVVRQMAEVHAGGTDGSPAKAELCTKILSELNEPGWAHLRDLARYLCVPETEAQDHYGRIVGLMLSGRMGQVGYDEKAGQRLAETGLSVPLDALKTALLDLQGPRDRAERAALLKLQARPQRAAAGATAHKASEFFHPVHRRIAEKLQASPSTLDPNEAWLLTTYKKIADDRNFRMTVQRSLASDPEAAAKKLEADKVSRFYVEMAQHAAEHESADLAARADEGARTYGPSLLILVSWPAWWAWRRWQRSRGAPIPQRPGALRRALAALFDTGLAVLAGLLARAVADEILWLWPEVPFELIDMAPVAILLLVCLGYLLLADALPLRHQRSLGKIAFHLRLVHDGAGRPSGRIPLSVAARRGAPMALMLGALMLWFLVQFDEGGGTGLDELQAYAVVPLLLLYWLPMALLPGGRTLGDRWSRTRVIDVDSEESHRVDAPPRYLQTLRAAGG